MMQHGTRQRWSGPPGGHGRTCGVSAFPRAASSRIYTACRGSPAHSGHPSAGVWWLGGLQAARRRPREASRSPGAWWQRCTALSPTRSPLWGLFGGPAWGQLAALRTQGNRGSCSPVRPAPGAAAAAAAHGRSPPPLPAGAGGAAPSAAMAGRLLGRLRSKDPGQLVQQCHQAFLKMPFEANPERVAEEISRLLHSMKVRREQRLGWREALPGGPPAAALACDAVGCWHPAPGLPAACRPCLPSPVFAAARLPHCRRKRPSALLPSSSSLLYCCAAAPHLPTHAGGHVLGRMGPPSIPTPAFSPAPLHPLRPTHSHAFRRRCLGRRRRGSRTPTRTRPC